MGIGMWLLVGIERARRAQGSEEADICNCFYPVYIHIWHRNNRPCILYIFLQVFMPCIRYIRTILQGLYRVYICKLQNYKLQKCLYALYRAF